MWLRDHSRMASGLASASVSRVRYSGPCDDSPPADPVPEGATSIGLSNSRVLALCSLPTLSTHAVIVKSDGNMTMTMTTTTRHILVVRTRCWFANSMDDRSDQLIFQFPAHLAPDRVGRNEVDLRSVQSGKCDMRPWVRHWPRSVADWPGIRATRSHGPLG